MKLEKKIAELGRQANSLLLVRKNILLRPFGMQGALLGLIALIIFFSITADSFLTISNGLNILDQISVNGLLSIGMTAVIIIGGIDLSVGAVLALSMMSMAWLANDVGMPMWLACIGSIIVGCICGIVNGLMVVKARLPSFIATLAMLSVARGLANMITNGSQIVGFPNWFGNLAISQYFGFLTPTVLLFLVLLVIGGIILKLRPSGRALYAIGGNAEVARLAGIPVKYVTICVFALSGLLAGLAAIVLSSELNAALPTAASGYELNAIAAVVIGGASLMGGTGSMGGTAIGIVIIGVLHNGLDLLGISPFMQEVVIGVVIALAVAADSLKSKLD